MTINQFITELEKLNIFINDKQLSQLENYYKLLILWNQKINLTRIVDKDDVYLKHFYDSLTLIKAIDLTKRIDVCDVGTGAGFPGIVLKIIFPNLKITLVDALNKRVEFLNLVIKELELKDIKALHERAEEYVHKNINSYDLVTCRAVSKLNIISEICLPLVKINGYFIPMKASLDGEIENIKYLDKLGGELEKVVNFELPYENSIRNLVVIHKIKESKKDYPRKYDKIKKNPL